LSIERDADPCQAAYPLWSRSAPEARRRPLYGPCRLSARNVTKMEIRSRWIAKQNAVELIGQGKQNSIAIW